MEIYVFAYSNSFAHISRYFKIAASKSKLTHSAIKFYYDHMHSSIGFNSDSDSDQNLI